MSKRETQLLSSPDWIGTSTWGELETTSRGPDHLENAVKTTPLGRPGRTSQAGAASNLLKYMKSPPRHDPTPIEKTRETDSPAPSRSPPCRTRRRSTVATVFTVQRSGTTESEPLAGCLAVATATTQRAGASPHLARRRTPPLVAKPKTPYAGASPRPPQYSMSWIRVLYYRQKDE